MFDGAPCEVKVSRTVLTEGKVRDDIRGLPIGIKLITFLLTLPRQSVQITLDRFIKEKGYEFTLDKQSLFEAR